MASYIRSIVGLVLIAVCSQGRLAAQKNRFCDLEEPSTFKLYAAYQHGRDSRKPISAERSRIETKLSALEALIQGSPVMNPPRGFAVDADLDYDLPAASAPRPWFTARLDLGTFPCLVLPDGKLGHGPEGFFEVDIDVNSLGHYAKPDDQNQWVFPDGRVIQSMRLPSPKPLGSFTIYGDPAECNITLTKGDVPPWVPVTREQFLTVLIHRNGVGAAKTDELLKTASKDTCGDAYTRWMSEKEQRLKTNQQAYEELKRSGLTAQAEDFRAQRQKLEAEWPAELLKEQAKCEERFQNRPKVSNPFAELVEAERAELSSLTAAERASQAWFSAGGDRLFSGLVPADTPRSLPLWAENPDFFGPSRPRTDFRVITVEVGTGTPLGCISKKAEEADDLPTRHAWRMYQFMTTTDWQRVAQLLD
jgi:hypothetical protein